MVEVAAVCRRARFLRQLVTRSLSVSNRGGIGPQQRRDAVPAAL